MKQGINFLLPVEIGMDLEPVEKIEFILRQEDVEMQFEYPSDKCIREGNVINLIFMQSDTWQFKTDVPCYLDTRITLTDSIYQPETELVKLRMNKTLFKEQING